VNTKGFVGLLSHDEVNQDRASGLGADRGLDVQLRLQPAPGKLLRTAVRGTERSVYVPVSRSSRPAPGAHDCIWRDARVALFVKAHQGEDGLVVDLRLIAEPPLPPTATTAWVADVAAKDGELPAT
jgi:hypothetical protein